MDKYGDILPEVLLVEDQRMVRREARKIIMEMGLFHGVEEAEHGQEAWEKIQERAESQFTVVVSDIYMPKLDGLGLLKLCREDERFAVRYLPFLLMSGDSNFETVGIAGEWGITEFLIKPITYVGLNGHLTALLNRIKDPTENSYVEIDWLKVNQRYSEAMDKLELIQSDSLTSRAAKWFNMRGEILMQMGQVDEARKYFEKALDGCGLYLRALKNYAYVQKELRNLQESVDAFEKLDNLSPNIERKILLAELLMEVDRKDDGAKMLFQAARLSGKDVEARIKVAEILDNNGFHEQAGDIYDGLLRFSTEAKTDDIDIHLRIAKSLRKQKRYEDAEKQYLKALELFPKNARLLYNLGVLYIYMRQEDKRKKACRLFQKALEIDPSLAQARRVYDQFCSNERT